MTSAACAFWGRWASPSRRRRGCGTTLPSAGPLPHCRHVVADGNGGVMITSLPGAVDMKPGSAARRSSAWLRASCAPTGARPRRTEPGSLVLTRPWPGMMLGVFQNETAFKDVYFPHPGRYLTGDGAYRDEDGYLWITGRIDDVINVSGHRIGTAEVESALVSYPQVAEAAGRGLPASREGRGHLRLRHGEGGHGLERRSALPAGRMCARASAPSPHPTTSTSRPARRRPQRQDHAPHPCAR